MKINLPTRSGIRAAPARRAASRPAALLAVAQMTGGGLMGSPAAQPAPAQDSLPSPGDSVWTMAANPDYEASGTWRFFWGDHYRDVWATPVRIPVLDLDRFAGGLTPYEKGGGLQTRSLRLRGADGKRYNFRSVDKEPSAAIPKWLRPTPAEDILQDQISSEHPYGALVSSALMDALGILHARPSIYVMPDHPDLGEFREEFAGMLGLLEEHPDENDEWGGKPFHGAEKVSGTDDLYEAIEENPLERVASLEFLKARLFDMWIGDWDRHGDQWRWARFPGDDLWYPIPEDRDNAFPRLDGLLPSRAHWADGRMVGFDDEYPPLVSLHLSAREMDRRFLTELTIAQFDSVAVDMVRVLGDSVIDVGVAALPPEIDALHGRDMRRALEKRRDGLADLARRFYVLLAEEAEAYGTDGAELLSFEVTSAGDLDVTLGLQGAAEPYFRRIFDPGETKEIRIWLEGGDDRVEVRGDEKLPIRVRVVGGGGDDVYAFPEGRVRNVWFYDDSGDDRVEPLGLAKIDRKHYDEWEFSEEDAHPPRDWGQRSRPHFKLSATSDYGLLVGVGILREGYGFRREPYSSRLEGTLAAATRRRVELDVTLDVRKENSPNHLLVRGLATQFEVLNFHGFGNDTRLEDRGGEYFDVHLNRIELGGRYVARTSDRLALGFGPRFRFSEDGENRGNLISTSSDLYGRGSFSQVGVAADIDWNSGDAALDRTAGLALEGTVNVTPQILDVDATYGSIDAAVRGYLPLPLGDRMSVLALRVGGTQVIGTAPWFDAAFLGGSRSLRGFSSQRFAGDQSLFGNAELRVGVFDYDLIVPQTFGVIGFADAGRVWVDGSSAGDWHTAFGGGIWIGLLGGRNALSAVVASGGEGARVYIGLGFPY